ncbi:Beta-ketoacyl synthase [Beggiatoa sp. SS]|nr:Beta-ketoacyl synthase [Beggiatoa sp. SS]
MSINEEYGSTETSLICFNQTYQPGSVGSVLEGVEVKLIDSETGQEVKPGELGEVLVRGPNVMLGYWNCPAETAQVLKEGWFHTGDIGRIDEEGYFYLVDRIKDMVNVGGLKVYPSEVENMLYQHPAVAEVAVYGVPEPLLGEQVIANIIPKSGIAVTTEEIVAFCRQNMADFKVPNLVELVESLPKGRTGKILKKILREQFKPRSSKRDESSHQKSPESLKQWLSDWLETELALDPETIETDRAFADYGLNSTLAVVLAQDLSEWLEQPIEPIITWNYPTIEQITAHLLTDRVEALPTKTVEPKAELSEVLHSSADTKEAELPASATEATSLGQPEPIAIIGMGCRFPGGANTPAQFWELLHNGVDTVTDIPNSRWNVDTYYDPSPNKSGKMYVKAGSFLKGIDQFDPLFFGISPLEAASLDPQQRLLLEVSWEALEHAGVAAAQLRDSLTGVFIGSFWDDYSALRLYADDPSQIDAYRTLSNLRGLAAGRIAYMLGSQGPSMQLDTTCSSSLLAVHLAVQSLRHKECHLALVGGVALTYTEERPGHPEPSQ